MKSDELRRAAVALLLSILGCGGCEQDERLNVKTMALYTAGGWGRIVQVVTSRKSGELLSVVFTQGRQGFAAPVETAVAANSATPDGYGRVADVKLRLPSGGVTEFPFGAQLIDVIGDVCINYEQRVTLSDLERYLDTGPQRSSVVNLLEFLQREKCGLPIPPDE